MCDLELLKILGCFGAKMQEMFLHLDNTLVATLHDCGNTLSVCLNTLDVLDSTQDVLGST